VRFFNVIIVDANATASSSLAVGGGVALHNSDSEAVLVNTSLQRCRAKSRGGGLWAQTTRLRAAQCIFQSNEAETGGGGVFANKTLLHISQSIFESNSAREGAALLYESIRSVDDPTSTVRETRFEGNLAPSDEGSIVNYILAPIEWACQQGQFMRVTDRIRTGDFYGCARPCAPGAIWETPYHSDPDCGGDCPSGSFCEAGQPPTPCVHGTYNPAPKATTRDNCIPCRPGTYNNLQGANGSSYCIPCPPGSLSEVVGAAFCDACPAGGYCSSEGAATVRQTYTPCQAGTYNPSTGSKGNTSCLACPSGKANPTPGSSSADDCHECLPGSVAPRNGTAICNLCVPGKRQSAQGQVSCLDCTEGSFCVQGSVLPAPCLAGTHSNSTGLTSAAECTMTNPGFFSPTGSIAPTPCAAGTVSPGWGSNVCMQCEPGKYQGAAGQTACEPCASGVYCKAAATQPVPCPSGRFSNSSRLASAASCEVCPLGYACATGASYPQKCTAGRYGDQPEQQGIQCSGPCREGHFCPEGSTSSSANACRELQQRHDLPPVHTLIVAL
jgi:hypothetical protein